MLSISPLDWALLDPDVVPSSAMLLKLIPTMNGEEKSAKEKLSDCRKIVSVFLTH